MHAGVVAEFDSPSALLRIPPASLPHPSSAPVSPSSSSPSPSALVPTTHHAPIPTGLFSAMHAQMTRGAGNSNEPLQDLAEHSTSSKQEQDTEEEEEKEW